MSSEQFPTVTSLETDEPAEISKTQLKREATELVDLAKAIATLSKSQLEAMPLDESLREAFELVRGMRKGPAIKRQFKYIGKLLRETDPEPLREALARQTQQDRFATARLHQLEHWRDRLLTGADATLSDYLAEFPDADRQHLRQLIRAAQKQQSQNKAPQAARKLFKYLREIQESLESDFGAD